MNYRFPLATSTWDELEYNALQRVISSGRFSMGSEVHHFEQDFAKFFGSKFAVMVNSGSSANLLMIASLFFSKNPTLKLGAGDEIIVPAVSWSTTYYPLYQYGLKMKFVDIDLQTLNYDLSALADAVTDETRAIMAVNLLGNPNDFDQIASIIGDRNIVLVEDNCESMGATYAGKFCGTFGVMGTFSCFYSHHISTMEGGVIVTDNEELYQIMLSLRAHGWTRNLPDENLVSGKKSKTSFEESFKFVLPGYNLRPLEMSGALGIEQLKKLPSIIEGRRDNGAIFVERLIDHPIFYIQQEIGDSSWFGFSLIIKPDAPVERVQCLKAFEAEGIECRPIVSGNFAASSVMTYFDYSVSGRLHNAEYLDSHGFFVGNHHYPITDLINTIADIDI